MAVNPLVTLGGVGLTAVAVVGGLYASGTGTTSGREEEGAPTATVQRIPGWRPASDDKAAANDYAASAYAHKYQKYLVGVDTKEEADKTPANNDEWWQWSFERYTGREGTGGFANTKVTSKDTLKTQCKAAYKTEDANIKKGASDTASAETDFKESEIWAYCSDGGTKIKTIEDAQKADEYSGNSDSNYGKKYKDKLVYKEGNDWFWNLKEEELKKENFTNTNTNDEFQKLKTALTGENSGNKSLKAVCEEAYKTQEQGTENLSTDSYPKTEIFRFCSLSGSSSQ